jgi:hypothetical protein
MITSILKLPARLRIGWTTVDRSESGSLRTATEIAGSKGSDAHSPLAEGSAGRCDGGAHAVGPGFRSARLCPCGTGNQVTMSTTDPDSSAALTPSEQLDEDELGTDPLEEAAEPEETWSGVDRHGTTPREQRTGTPSGRTPRPGGGRLR